MPGNVLGLEINGDFVSCETSCEMSFENDLLPASSITSGAWKEYIPGVKSWSVTVNAGMLLRMAGTGLNTILNAFLTGQLMGIRIATKYDDELPSFAIVGNVRLRTGGFSAAVNSLANWNATLEGDGPFTAEINDNIVFAISTNEDDTQLLQDGLGNLIVSTNSQNSINNTEESHGAYSVQDLGQPFILIPHGLNLPPSYWQVNPVSEAAINNSILSISVDAVNLIVTPVIMINNNLELKYTWEAKV